MRNVALWKSQTAMLEDCGGEKSNVVMRDGGRTRRVLTTAAPGGSVRLVLRARSLAVIEGLGDQRLVRVLDHGRRCPKVLARVVEEEGIWAGVGSKTLTWAIAGYEFDGVRFSGLQVSSIDFSGRCQTSPSIRVAPRSQLPQTPFNANGPIGFNGVPPGGLAIDGRTLYYATDIGIHRLPLSETRRP